MKKYKIIQKNALDLDDLLKHDYVDFVTHLYRQILLREPDNAGLSHYLKLLNHGVSKEVIIYQMYSSNEARSTRVYIQDIDKFKNKFNRYRIKQFIKKTPFMWLYRIIALPKNISKLQDDFGLFLLGQEYKQIQSEHKLKKEFAKQSELIIKLEKSTERQIATMVRDQLSSKELFDRQYKQVSDLFVDLNELYLTSLKETEKYYNDIKKIVHIQKEELLQTNSSLLSYLEQVHSSHQDSLQKISSSFHGSIAEISEQLTETSKLKRAISCGNDIVVTELDEFLVGIPAEEWRMAGYIAFRGQLEPGFTQFFRNFVKEGMVVIDIGANIGVYTLIAAKLVGNSGKVYSFEPTPRTFDLLKNNRQLNGFLETNRVILQQIAVSNRQGEATFAVYNDNSGHNTLFPKEKNDTVINVQTNTLDNVIDPNSVVDLVKIDVEGSEAFVLNGMKNIVRRNDNIVIALEFAPSHLIRAGIALQDFVKQLREEFHIKLIHHFSGELLDVTTEELISCYSMNILLTKIKKEEDPSL